jgi:hypothetical protein
MAKKNNQVEPEKLDTLKRKNSYWEANNKDDEAEVEDTRLQLTSIKEETF